jgi:hypothetical protein
MTNMKIIGNTYERNKLERGDVFHHPGSEYRFVVISNNNEKRNDSLDSYRLTDQFLCLDLGAGEHHYRGTSSSADCVFVGKITLDESDDYDQEELKHPRPDSGSVSDTDAINKMRIDNCLNDFDFKKVEALNRILLKSTILDEVQLKSLARQMMKACLEDDNSKIAYNRSPSNLLVTRQDDELILWYAPIGSAKIKIEPKQPKCDGIRKLDLDD